ncbi:MAG TPA: hypothetical protein DDY32_00990 [Desulfobulbaceae bacterium]|nr:hypothetical protein [Desulfobulbaceae bacterium]
MKWDDDLKKGSPVYNFAWSKSKTICSVAGPGTGKSFAIKRRIARLMEDGVNPKKILAITFTRTAAKDLKTEISSLAMKGTESVVAKTLHSHALSILMRNEVIEKTGRIPRMILDHEMNSALHDLDDDDFGGIKDKKKLVGEYLAAWATMQVDDPGYAKNKTQEKFEIRLIKWMKYHKGMLVGEVIPLAIEYLKYNPASEAIGYFDIILVDEYQDLNKSEQQFIKLIRGDAEIVIVGDDDQSIYGFKYAHPAGIQKIDKLHGKYEAIPFDECRRCPTTVTKMASNLIGKNPNRTLGDLIPFRKNPKGDVNIIQWSHHDEEVPGIVQIIIKELKSGLIDPGDILILSPRRIIGYQLRDYLLAEKVPVKSYFRESTIKKAEVQKAFSLLNLLSEPDDCIALRYLLGVGSSSFRASSYKKLVAEAVKRKCTVRVMLDLILKKKIEVKGVSALLKHYIKILEDIIAIKDLLKVSPESLFEEKFITREELEIEFYELNQIYLEIIADLGADEAKKEGTQQEWIRSVFNKMQELVTNPEIPDDIDHIRIMSLHSSKGLSNKMVIMCSMIDELIPYLTKEMTEEEVEHHIQEQRRLFYVATTRCKGDASYSGKLIVSSFTKIFGTKALQMGIGANPKKDLKVTTTRYISEFGKAAPAPILGSTLI